MRLIEKFDVQSREKKKEEIQRTNCSMTDPFGGNRIQARPPERGVFPLDHDRECAEPMKVYLQCLKENKNDHFPCKAKSKAYLKCRMDNALMAKEDLNKLGLDEGSVYERKIPNEGQKENEGFISGLGVKPSNRWMK
jgi:cytochrome c oxidase assembly protein subunit 19